MYLGIDLGSTFLKSSLLNTELGTVTALDSRATPAFLPLTEGRREIDIEELAQEVAALIDAAMAEHPIKGVLFSVQMHGFMLFCSDGTPATGYATWQDTRANHPNKNGTCLFDEINGGIPKRLFAENGIVLAPNHSLLPLCHHLREHPEHKDLEFAMIGDAVARVLTGKKVPLHPSQAASTGLFSLKDGNWNKKLIEALGLGDIVLPEVSEKASQDALYKGIPLLLSVGDHQAAVLGIGAAAGDLFINIATGGQVGYIDEIPVLGNFETRPFFGGRAIRTFTDLPSGRDLSLLMEFVKSVGSDIFGVDASDREVWAAIDSAAEKVQGCALDVDLRFSEGSGCIGAIGQSGFSAGELFVGAWCSMAKACRQKAELLLGDEKIEKLILTGGVLRRNPRLVAMIEEQFGIAATLPASSDDTMQGLLALARDI